MAYDMLPIVEYSIETDDEQTLNRGADHKITKNNF